MKDEKESNDKPLTNADLVRQMDDKTLKEAWERIGKDDGEKLYEWLNKPAKEVW